MSNLTILNCSIRTLDNLYSLNDFHVASGNNPNHRPNQFIRLETTKALANAIETENANAQICAFKTLRGSNGGTYACQELVIAYAAWISPAFHLKVIRAFMALNGIKQQPTQLALPEPEKTFHLHWTESELKTLASFWCATFEMHNVLKKLDPILQELGSNLAPMVYSQVREYQSTLDLIHHRLQVDIDPLQYADPENPHWQYCLETINRYKRRTATKLLR